MDLSIVVPAFNEEKRIGIFLESTLDYLRVNYRGQAEVLVVDDGSHDRTSEIAAQLVGPANVIRLDRNRGKGAAVREGMRRAKGKFRLFADADGSTPISEVERLMAAIEAGADVAIGSRAGGGGQRYWSSGLPLPASTVPSPPTYPPQWHVLRRRHVTGRVFSAIVRLLTGLSHQDTQCGFKLFRAEAALRLFEMARVDRFAFDVELLMLAARLELKVEEVAVNWHEVDGSKVRLFRDSWQMFHELWRLRNGR